MPLRAKGPMPHPAAIPVKRPVRRRSGHGWRERLGLDGPHRGRRLLALFAAVAVPAMAAPGEWSTLSLDPAAPNKAVRAMPFETAGDSFPGSAFFYLEDLPQAPQGDLALSDTLPPRSRPARTPTPSPRRSTRSAPHAPSPAWAAASTRRARSSA